MITPSQNSLIKLKKYIKFVLSLQYIAGLAAKLLLFLIPRALPAFMMSATTFIVVHIVFGQMFAPTIIYLRKPLRKPRRLINLHLMVLLIMQV